MKVACPFHQFSLSSMPSSCCHCTCSLSCLCIASPPPLHSHNPHPPLAPTCTPHLLQTMFPVHPPSSFFIHMSISHSNCNLPPLHHTHPTTTPHHASQDTLTPPPFTRPFSTLLQVLHLSLASFRPRCGTLDGCSMAFAAGCMCMACCRRRERTKVRSDFACCTYLPRFCPNLCAEPPTSCCCERTFAPNRDQLRLVLLQPCTPYAYCYCLG